jgi:tryptophan 2,3-dioxygenase
MPGRLLIVVRQPRAERTSAPSKSGNATGFVAAGEGPPAVVRPELEHAASTEHAASAAKRDRMTQERFEENLATPRKLRLVPLSYGSYLKIDELLALQQPLSKPAQHDEMLFIVIHQVYELWFKQVLHEVDATMAALDRDDLLRVAKNFRRIHTIQRLLEEQVDILETMAPQEFNLFRDHLNPASGFQSVQFRELEFACGVRRTDVLQWIELDAAQRERLQQRLNEPSIYDRVKALLRRRGFAVDSSEELIETYRRIYSNEKEYYDLFLLLEDLIEFDERFLLWRGRHVRMVERMIGQKHGTGGSLGARYLEGTLSRRFFPELWEVRTYLGEGTYG